MASRSPPVSGSTCQGPERLVGDPLNNLLQPQALGFQLGSRFVWADTGVAIEPAGTQVWHNYEQELSSGRCLPEKYFAAKNTPAGIDTVGI